MMSYFCKPFRSFEGAFIYFYSSSYSLFTTKTGVNPPNATHRLPPKFRCPVLPSTPFHHHAHLVDSFQRIILHHLTDMDAVTPCGIQPDPVFVGNGELVQTGTAAADPLSVFVGKLDFDGVIHENGVVEILADAQPQVPIRILVAVHNSQNHIVLQLRIHKQRIQSVCKP